MGSDVAEHLAIEAEGLVKRFGDVRALAGVDVRVASGVVLALLGPNGAGKTTLVRILSTLVPPDAGRAAVMGLDVVRHAGAVRRVVGLSGQYAAVDGYLTGRENLRMIGRLCGLGRAATRQRADRLLEAFDLAGGADRTARTYSGGMRRRLDVAAALVAAPRVLFLDEPTTGLDPRGRAGLWALLEELTAAGTSILLTTQYLEEADRLADEIVVLDHGAVIAAGTAEQLKAQVGGDRLELQTPAGTDPRPLAAAMTGLGSAPPVVDADVDTDTARVIVPVADGPAVLPAVARRLAEAGLAVTDLAVRRPTLDDVFLTLTGQAPDRREPTASPPPAAGGPSSPRTSPPPGQATGGHLAPDRERPDRERMAGPGRLLSNAATITGRNLHRLVRVPTLIAFATAQPVMFVLLFTYTFGGAIHPPGVPRYIDYALPGIWVLAIAFGASQTGVALADDLAAGMIDRFRALPMARSAVLAGRTIADAIRNLFVLALMTGVASALGFRFHTGPAAALAAAGLALAVGLAFSWIFALLGLIVRDPESAGLGGLLAVIPLIFTSSTFVPVATFPAWLQTFADINPITITVDALRVLCLGGPTTTPLWQATAWIAALLAVTVPAAGWRYRRTTAA